MRRWTDTCASDERPIPAIGFSSRLVIRALACLLVVSARPASALTDIDLENRLLSEADRAHEDTEAMTRLEPRAIAAAEPAAARSGSRLDLHLRSGGHKIYEDDPSCLSTDVIEVTHCRAFTLLAYARSRHLFLMSEGHYEGGFILMVDDTDGTETRVDDFPILSPKGDLAVILKNSDMGDADGIEIWRRQGTQLIKEWSGDPMSGDGRAKAYHRLDKWRTANELALHAEMFTGYGPTPVIKRFLLRYASGAWRVVEGQ